MRLAVVSDIHGNLEAFTEVLSDIERSGADGIISLGDNIGYGANPEEAVQLIRSRGIASVMGNHELGIARPENLADFNMSARQSLLLTQQLISLETKEWLTGLPASLALHGALFVHGCPPDSVTDYIFAVSDTRLKRLFSAMECKVSFIGHTHTLELISCSRGRVLRRDLGLETVRIEPDSWYVINIGSVGQPRDGNCDAKYVLWDVQAGTVEVRFVPYDIARAAEKIIRLGFPEENASRLW
ncbi:MAG: metallophosphoesterase [Syntrophobacteraceae bacterium]